MILRINFTWCILQIASALRRWQADVSYGFHHQRDVFSKRRRVCERIDFMTHGQPIHKAAWLLVLWGRPETLPHSLLMIVIMLETLAGIPSLRHEKWMGTSEHRFDINLIGSPNMSWDRKWMKTGPSSKDSTYKCYLYGRFWWREEGLAE